MHDSLTNGIVGNTDHIFFFLVVGVMGFNKFYLDTGKLRNAGRWSRIAPYIWILAVAKKIELDW